MNEKFLYSDLTPGKNQMEIHISLCYVWFHRYVLKPIAVEEIIQLNKDK